MIFLGNLTVFIIIDENWWKLISVGVFIDLQKAFDIDDHEILLKKLDDYGIRDIKFLPIW